MLTKAKILEKLQALMPELRDRFGVETIGFFGSFSRDEASEDSDIDLVVTYKQRPKGWDYFSLGIYLEDVFGRKVDLAEPHCIKHQIREKVMSQVNYI
ncbi:nucleotidyltransferase family protein [Flavimarina sp. Hel_I_48]|uniref:nucleotidyltransferase family protein n=1 Tax=Flavimarina sp. Hel_I_48 TaxID=1392488 RepID=UPI0004DF4B51|nr:nucleotidyltransferase family protein [Flavimarina sp. Hel_I_48]